MKNCEINIRDPFILAENGEYYMYGTRAKNFGTKTGGFDVYKSRDLENWSNPVAVLHSENFGLNTGANWAPEVHKYNGRYYMFATFEQKNSMRGTYSFVSDSPDGEFILCSENALTPFDWWSLDGTLYVDKNNIPYLVFCHEHVQILNGTVCYVRLSSDLSQAVTEPICMFYGSDATGAVKTENTRYVTDGPFLYRGESGNLYMIWSSCVNGQYYQCVAKSENGKIDGRWKQIEPLFTKDGGHGMIFKDFENRLKLVLHCPNIQLDERPVFFNIAECDGKLAVVE